MSILVGIESLSFAWPAKKLFSDLKLSIFEGDHIGIVGENGSGKSTLLELICEQLEPDSGQIIWRNNTSYSLLSQHDSFDDDDLLEHAVFGDTPRFEWASDPFIREIYEALIGELALDAKIAELSGGERRRCDLVRALTKRSDVLLLDEPTNQLDILTITWLAEHLQRRYKAGEGALILITHDRWFLDEVVNSIWELHDSRVSSYEGGYSAFIQQRVERQRQEAEIWTRHQNYLRKELKWLSRGAQARTSKPKFRIEEARKLLELDPPIRKSIELKHASVARLGKQVFELKHVSFAYDKHPILDELDWIIGPGERLGILGENGAGKSSFLKLLGGRLEPSAGSLVVGKSVRIGWLSQDIDLLHAKEDWTVLEFISSYKRHIVLDGKEYSASQLLERLGFNTAEFSNRISDLSGGQRRRLSILATLLQEPNVLLLDEPGNDLDTEMLTVLEDILDSWPATMILVTHDRHLLERVCDDLYLLEGGKITHLPRGVDEYLEHAFALRHRSTGSAHAVSTSEDTKQEAAINNSGSKGSNSGGDENPKPTLSNAERRAKKKRFDAIERRLSRIEEEEGELHAQSNKLDTSDYLALMEHDAKLKELSEEKEALELEWLELGELLGPAS